MSSEPFLRKRAGRDDREPAVAGIGESGANEGVAHAQTASSGRYFGVLEVENRVGEKTVHQLGFASRDVGDKALVLEIMVNGQGISGRWIQ